MIESGWIASFMTEPPCTSFSPAAHPMVRSYAQPEGFCLTEEKTYIGNLLADRSFLLLRHGWKHGRPCGKQQPRLSKMRWLKKWAWLRRDGFGEFVCASCQFGSIHKKEFVFLSYLLDSLSLEKKCPGGRAHVRIEGAYTKPSAVYEWGLADHLAAGFEQALLRRRGADDGPDVAGLESIIINDVLSSSSWKKEKCWSWKRKSHINVLEGHAGLALLNAAAQKSRDARFLGLMDSRVAKGALAKGRSSSTSLQAVCRRSCALQVSIGLCPGWNFAPTHYNVADDPTRLVSVRKAVKHSIIPFLNDREVQILHACQLKRCAANWLRLVLLATFVLPSSATAWTDSHVFLSTCVSYHCSALPGDPWIWIWGHLDFLSLSMRRAATISDLWIWIWDHFASKCLPWILQNVLAPFILLSLLACFISLIHVHSRFSVFFWILLPSCQPSAAMEPQTVLERERALRRSQIDLVATRVVRRDTLQRRHALLAEFRVWLHRNFGVMLSVLLPAKPPDPEEINRYLVLYGQEMFAAGKAFGRFAETVNAVLASRPLIRKQMTASWDLCFAWLADEPTQHHPALPLSILLAMMGLALMWGWPVEAAVFGLAWSGLLRIGEVIMAKRDDLILPDDAAPGVRYALLRINSPKTRGRAARRQAARIDPPDLINLLSAVFGRLNKEKKLRPFSATALRKRFCALLSALGLPTKRLHGKRPFDLGSLRPGGATHLFLESEDAECVRRRGRWVSSKVMDIYIQEAMYTTYTEQLVGDTRLRVEQLSSAFERILDVALTFLYAAIPPSTWLQLYQAEDIEELGREWGKDG